MVIGSFSYHNSLWRDVAMCIDHFSSKKLSTREEIVGEKSAWVNLFTIARHGTVAARHISDVRGWKLAGRSRRIMPTLVPRRRGVWSGGVRSWRRTGCSSSSWSRLRDGLCLYISRASLILRAPKRGSRARMRTSSRLTLWPVLKISSCWWCAQGASIPCRS